MFKLYKIDEFGVKNYSPFFPLLLTIIFLFMVIVVGALLLYEYESGNQVKTFGDAIWLAFMGASTVGYGDLFPVSQNGRIVVGVISSLGICAFGAIGTFTAMIAFSFFDTESKNRELKAQNAEIIKTNQISIDGNNEIIRTNLLSIAGNDEIERTNLIAIAGNTSIETKLDKLLKG